MLAQSRDNSGMGMRAVLFAAAWIGSLAAQEYTSVFGVIRDPSGAVVPGASVVVVSESSGFRRTTQSRTDGTYMANPLQPGLCKITVRKEGFRTLVRLGVKVDVARPARVDFELPLGSMQEVVTVRDAPLLLNGEGTALGTLITSEPVDRLPLNGRDLLGLLSLTPGIVSTPATRGEAGQFSSTGQRPNTNSFTIDGVSANTGVIGGGLPAQSPGGSLPGMTALGSSHNLVSLDAIDEFRVLTSTGPAEFGRLPGAQVSISTRTGGNDFHGSMFHFLRNEKLDANDWFANRGGYTRAPLRLNDFGATLAGPVWRNHTFFFVSYERLQLRQPFAWRAAVPTLESRLVAQDWVRSVLNLFPAPNGPSLGPNVAEWTGRNLRPSGMDPRSLRLDHAISSRLSIFARASDTPSFNEFSGTQISDLSVRSRSLTAGVDFRVNPNFIFSLRANRSEVSGRFAWRPAVAPQSACYLQPVTMAFFRVEGLCNYLFRFSIAGVGQVVNGLEGDQRQSQWHFVPTAVITVRGHHLSLGADYRRLEPRRRDHSNSLNIMAENLDSLLTGRTLWYATGERLDAGTRLTEIGLFAQDTWRLNGHLTATFGIRWEFSAVPRLNPDETEHSLRPVAYLFPGQTEIWRRRGANLAPRLGIAFRPVSEGRTVLRAGWGLYYDSSLSVATDLVNGGPFSISQYGGASSGLVARLLSFGFEPGLRLPVVEQWNASIERAFAGSNTVSIAYAGSSGRRLIRREMGGPESTPTLWVALATNHGYSDYHGLQFQYRKSMSRRIQATVAYTWAHSLDNSSSDSGLHWVGKGISSDRGSSDFDVRHALASTISYETPRRAGGSALRALVGGVGVDAIVRTHTGFPITVLGSEQAMGLSFANVFRPDTNGWQPAWVPDPSAPGGKRLNPEAFRAAPALTQGSWGRNALTGFGTSQIDLALRRGFSFGEQRSLDLRIEGFNILNHPNFADPVRYLVSPLFGESPSMMNLMLGTGSPGSGLAPIFQSGGARSLQVSLRLRF
jgi:carboxypeptidase family protein/TonB-dependent receptor-like protein